MGQRIDISGRRFGFLVAKHPIQRVPGTKKELYWLCRCDCGNEKKVPSRALFSGKSKSCGCMSKALASESIKKHGQYKSREYGSWCAMKQRCLNPDSKHFRRYGERGIGICNQWIDSFEQFLADMGRRPKDTTLERIDNNQGYFPENCMWASRRQQQNNTSRNRVISAFGESMTVTMWSRKIGIPLSCLVSRVHRGWDADRALTQPVQPRKKKAAA
jgi:hypothetical protein